MKITTILTIGLLLMQVPLASSIIDGNITNVDWPKPYIHVSTTMRHWITIENTGSEATGYHVQFSIQDSDGKWYTSACWPTDMIEVNESKVVWPYSIEVTSSMPRGEYDAKITLFSDYCGRNENILDSVTNSDAFFVSA
jgi:hypothetical protein